jgi:hypothetical protein
VVLRSDSGITASDLGDMPRNHALGAKAWLLLRLDLGTYFLVAVSRVYMEL